MASMVENQDAIDAAMFGMLVVKVLLIRWYPGAWCNIWKFVGMVPLFDSQDMTIL
ncbi:hypothetical protein AXX17_AT1G40580 [Arabidopsis thaliana]|uniref:Uncharacterized protein n=1 Tax=Arabidopsis thaliana TaxID=3702 RepID=A0A178W1X7_ARATH|nr:hypothetical protein AXX17_AT1G40580 [Arabidopsis thaliana]